MSKHITKEAYCAGCGTVFGSRDRGSNRGWTRFCSNTCRGHHQGYKGGAAASRLRRRYGMEPEEYEALLKEQDGKCALCLAVPKYKLYVDHDHLTKKNRSLLCARCNTAIGVFDQLDWDEVLLYWGYSRHHDAGKRLVELAGKTRCAARRVVAREELP
jgi:hypothetical protein